MRGARGDTASGNEARPVEGRAIVRMSGSMRVIVVVGVATAVVLGAAKPASAQLSFTGPTNFPAGDEPFSVAVDDFNGDGDPDLAVANFAIGRRVGAARRPRRHVHRADQLPRRRRARLGGGR